MRRLTELTFAVRTDADLTPDAPSKPYVSPEDLAAALEQALGCTFTDGRFRRHPALVGEALGVTVSLLEWRGVNGKRVFLLHGNVIEPRFWDGPVDQTPELARLDVSPYLVDLLNVRTPYLWYQPDAADLAAENEHARAIDRAYGH